MIAVPGTGSNRLVAQVVEAIGELAGEAFLALDADEAGRRYTAKLAAALGEAGIRAVVVGLPDGLDLAAWLASVPEGNRGEALAAALIDAEAGNAADGPEEERAALAVSVREFVAAEEEFPEPLLGTPDDCILPALGIGLLVARGGKGKTTFTIDLCLHLASGRDFLGIPVERALNLLLIENEGPRWAFRRKLERRLEHWPHELKGHFAIYTESWGLARLDLAGFVERLNEYCDEHAIDLVVGDPLDSLGMEGEGSPSETREMVDRLKAAGLFRDRAWWLPHHARKDSVTDAVDEASGAWGGRPDAMLALEKRTENQARLSFPKVRWQARERRPYLLEFDPESEAFSFLREEEGEERDYAVEIEEFLDGKPPKTAGEIVAGINAGKSKVEDALRAHPDRFDVLTGEAAKAAGRSPNARLYTLRSSLDSASSPESPDPFSGGVS